MAQYNYRLLSAAASTNGTLIKPSQGIVWGFHGYNTKAGLLYMKFYNTRVAPTVGTDTPIYTLTLKASDYLNFTMGPQGLYFGNGISFAITGAGADNDTTNLSAGDITGLNILYD